MAVAVAEGASVEGAPRRAEGGGQALVQALARARDLVQRKRAH